MHKTDLKARITLAGCFLFGLVVSASATCQDVNNCLAGSGSALPSDVADASSVISFLCQEKSTFLQCFNKLKGCDAYNAYVSFYPSQAQAAEGMEVLCSHRTEYTNAIQCVMNAATSITPADLTSSTCSTQLSPSALQNPDAVLQDCTLLDKLSKCSPIMKKTLSCTAKLMVLMGDNNSTNIPCFDVYKSISSELSSGSRLSAYSVILLAGWLIAFVIKRF